MEEVANNSLERARQVLAEGDFKYARFLCYDILYSQLENIEARRCLNEIRIKFSSHDSLLSDFQKIWQFFRTKYFEVFKKGNKQLLVELEKYADLSAKRSNCLRKIAAVASDNEFTDLAIYSLETIPDAEKTDDDYIELAKIYMSLKKYNSVLNLANIVIARSPENIDARDLANKASAAKSTSGSSATSTRNGVPIVDVSTLIPKIKSPEPAPQQRKNGVGRF